MNLEGMILSKINQAEKYKYYIVSLTCGILLKKINKQKKLIDTENRFVVT